MHTHLHIPTSLQPHIPTYSKCLLADKISVKPPDKPSIPAVTPADLQHTRLRPDSVEKKKSALFPPFGHDRLSASFTPRTVEVPWPADEGQSTSWFNERWTDACATPAVLWREGIGFKPLQTFYDPRKEWQDCGERSKLWLQSLDPRSVEAGSRGWRREGEKERSSCCLFHTLSLRAMVERERRMEKKNKTTATINRLSCRRFWQVVEEVRRDTDWYAGMQKGRFRGRHPINK